MQLRALLAAPLLAAVCATPAAAGIGAPGVGDPYFPKAGNGGYQVVHYKLRLRFRPVRRQLGGTAILWARTTQALDRFDLDFRGFRIRALTVRGVPATWRRKGQELVVTPSMPIPSGEAFRVNVKYRGTPHHVVDPDGTWEGWVRTEDGAFVPGEPQGSPSWFPCNDHPTDKATYDITMIVPRGLTAVSNGKLVSKRKHPRTTAFRWRETRPMATYLATVTTGRFTVRRGRTASGIPTYTAFDPRFGQRGLQSLRKLNEIVEFFRRTFGPYPFETVGGVVDSAPSVGYSLESQTKPLYAYVPDEGTVAHETAHQWFGDSVTLSSWPDIWLNEGFATWSEWLWDEHKGRQTAQARFDDLYGTPESDTSFWNPPPGDPGGPENLFAGSVYVRGAMTLQALRQKVGNGVFASILRAWAADHRYGTVSTADFVALAETESGLDLDAFFQTWLYTPGKPASW